MVEVMMNAPKQATMDATMDGRITLQSQKPVHSYVVVGDGLVHCHYISPKKIITNKLLQY